MIIILVEFIDQLIDYPINCASLRCQYGKIINIQVLHYSLHKY